MLMDNPFMSLPIALHLHLYHLQGAVQDMNIGTFAIFFYLRMLDSINKYSVWYDFLSNYVK